MSSSATVESILVLHNVAKKKNFGELIRTAAALGVTEIIVVGASKLQTFGSQGTTSHARFSHFTSLADAVQYLHEVRGAVIAGVEIAPGAEPVQSHPFRGTTAFIMGNEGHGLTAPQLEACDQLVYIPQHSTATASLNVNAAAAIVLHHFASWAALPEVARDDQDPTKFAVTEPLQGVARSGVGLKQMRTLLPDGTPAPRRGREHDTQGGSDDDGVDDEAWAEAAFDAYGAT